MGDRAKTREIVKYLGVRADAKDELEASLVMGSEFLRDQGTF